MIAIDVMGGDFAPGVGIKASVDAAKKGVSVVLFGQQDLVIEHLNAYDPSWKNLPVSIVDAPEVIAMDDDAVFAVRKKKQSSLVMAVQAVAEKKVTAVVSAGNSGALMAAAAFILGREDGVERPPIAGFMSSHKGSVLILDLGAHTDCRPQHLLQFARLGVAYYKQRGLLHPTVGLLSNGREPGKGSLLVKDAYQLLSQEAGLNFVGNVEPYDIVQHTADIVVCDGFAGNILLKMQEAVLDAAVVWAKDPGVIPLYMTHKTVGGAVLLGVKGRVIVSHGASDEKMLQNAILFANQKS